MDEIDVTKEVSPELAQMAMEEARYRASTARWSLGITIFLFAVLIIIIILLFQGIGIEVVAPVAIFGLAMVWLVGWRQGRSLYHRFYNVELARLLRESKGTNIDKEALGETEKEVINRTLEQR